MNGDEKDSTFWFDQALREHYRRRPQWVTRQISRSDALFLGRGMLREKVEEIVEIGSCSGFSAGLLCQALAQMSQAGLIGPKYRVISYDLYRYFKTGRLWYFKTGRLWPWRRIGAAAREQLTPELMAHIEFRNPFFSLDLRKFHAPGSISCLFVDANHRHPWPALDILACLDLLAPDALVFMHDINLPAVRGIPDAGAQILFDSLPVSKERDIPADGSLGNIGSFRIPRDREGFETELRKVIGTHPWQTAVAKRYLEMLDLKQPSGKV
jgi:hypothetical protein